MRRSATGPFRRGPGWSRPPRVRTGLDVLRAARTEDRLADVRFIVLSAMYMTKNERQVLGPRVAAVVRKGETMPRALTFALHRAVVPARAGAEAHPDEGGRHL